MVVSTLIFSGFSSTIHADFIDATHETDIGSVVNDIEAGMCLSYDLIDRTLSPYFGVIYEWKLGQTENTAQVEGEDTEGWRADIGTKLIL